MRNFALINHDWGLILLHIITLGHASFPESSIGKEAVIGMAAHGHGKISMVLFYGFLDAMSKLTQSDEFEKQNDKCFSLGRLCDVGQVMPQPEIRETIRSWQHKKEGILDTHGTSRCRGSQLKFGQSRGNIGKCMICQDGGGVCGISLSHPTLHRMRISVRPRLVSLGGGAVSPTSTRNTMQNMILKVEIVFLVTIVLYTAIQ